MNIYAKAGIAVAVATGGLIGAHHLARAADPVPAAAKAEGRIKIPATLEAHIRAMARAHAGEAGVSADDAEAHVMAMLHAHLAEVAKDPALFAQVNQVMAQAEAGDEDAMEHIHHVLVQMLHGGH